MIKKFLQLGSKFFFSLASLLVVFLLMNLLNSESLDIRLYYTGEQARQFLTSLSFKENRVYLITELIDFFLFIPAYTLTLFLGIKQLCSSDRKIWLWAFAPAIFDVIETALIIYALASTANHTYFDWLGLVTFFKWLLALGAVITFFRKLKQQSLSSLFESDS
jgi:hypothetical protein